MTHTVPYEGLLGCMVYINYQDGDFVQYGGALYKPTHSFVSGVVPTAGGITYLHYGKHRAEVWHGDDGRTLFYCS